jgi:hypothetical protein
LPEIVQDIGAYAGIASVVGLALLSALYFSQARDVKRLREWAGRAPERSEQGTPAVPGRVVAQPQPPKPATTPPQVPGKPVTPGKPAATTPAAAAAAGAGAATAQQGKPGGAPVPAGQNANAAAPGDGPAKDGAAKDAETAAQPATAAAAAASGAGAAEAKSGAASPPPGGPPTQPSAAAGTATPSAPAPPSGPSPDAPAAPGGASPGGPAKPGAPSAPGGPTSPGVPPSSAGSSSPSSSPPGGSRPTVPPARPPSTPPRQAATPAGNRAPSVPAGEGRVASRPGVTSRQSPQETAILPPRSKSRVGLTPRYLAVALVGLLVLGGAAAFGVTQLTGDDDGGNQSQSASGDDATNNGAGKQQRKQGAVKPGSVTVAVLNGTTVPGLAATLSDEVNAAGFKVGTITNFSDQQLAESVVQYAPGHQAEARAVSRRLGIAQREPVNPSSQALAGDATVIVIAGADKAP